MKNDSVWVAVATTDSGDTYVYAFKKKPTETKIATMIWKGEGEIEDLGWYKETTLIDITKQTILE